jgi:4-amino-4-deoxy-L-arabinose transferase-like glycosyltransferase
MDVHARGRFSSLQSLVGSRQFLIWLTLVATLFRLALIAKFGKTVHFYDEFDYDRIGTSVARGFGFMDSGHYTAYRAPGQPAFIGLIYALFGHSIAAVEVGEAFLSAMLPIVCANIAKTLGLSNLAANIAAGLVALHPALAFSCTTIYPTVLTACALTLGIFLCGLAVRNNGLWMAVGAGLSLGVAAMATTTFSPIAVLAALVIALKRRYRVAALVLLVGTAPVAAWMVRNKVVLGAYTVATNGGQNLALGANDKSTPMSGNWIEVAPLNLGGTITELSIDDNLKLQAFSWIHAHPRRYTELALARGVLVFDSVGHAATAGVQTGRLAHFAGWLLLPPVLVGLVGLCLYRRDTEAMVCMAGLALVILSSAATMAKPRFRFPCDPVLFVFAIAAVARRKTAQVGNNAGSNHVAAGDHDACAAG